MENFENLKEGDIIRNTGSGNEYRVVDPSFGDGAIYAWDKNKKIGKDFVNPSEWELVNKTNPEEAISKSAEMTDKSLETVPAPAPSKVLSNKAVKEFLYPSTEDASFAAVGYNAVTTETNFDGNFMVTDCGGNRVSISAYVGEDGYGENHVKALRRIRELLEDFLALHDKAKEGFDKVTFVESNKRKLNEKTMAEVEEKISLEQGAKELANS